MAVSKNFYSELAKHPIAALKIVNASLIKNFFVTVFYASKEERKRIFFHYSDLLSKSSRAHPTNDKPNDYSKIPRVFPSFDQIEVSIIVPVYNQWPLTDNCLRSIIWSVKDVSYEVILADDSSTDDTRNAARLYKNLNIARTEGNQGFLLNCKQAATKARGRYILFLNNDTEVHNYWLESLYRKMEEDDTIALCGSKLVYPDGRLQEAGGIIWDDASGWNYGRLDDPGKPEYCYTKDVDYVSGASLMVRKSFWDEVDGFDERYIPAYYEDTDLAFEAVNRGKRVVFHPHSVVTHFEGQSHGVDESAGVKAYQLRNKTIFFDKWQAKLSKDHFPNGTNVFHARDRSDGKRTLLIIDHYVPWYDKDAGSKSTFMYIEAFVELGYNVKFIGDNFFPHQPYTDALCELGVEVLYGNHYAKDWKQWITSNASSLDVVYLHRPHIAPKYIDFIKENTDAKIVYQSHDLHHVRSEREYAITGDPLTKAEAEQWKIAESELFNKADVSLTFSADEKKYLLEHGLANNVHQVPLYLYDNATRDLPSFAERSDIMFVGGFGHGPNEEGLLWFSNEIWPKLLEKEPSLTLRIAGSSMPDSIKALRSSRVEILGRLSDNDLAHLYKKSRVSILPLLHGAGVKGKLVESLRYKTPVVSTGVGLEGVNAADYGMLPHDNAEDFAQEVLKLVNSEDYWLEQQACMAKLFSAQFLKEPFMKTLREIF